MQQHLVSDGHVVFHLAPHIQANGRARSLRRSRWGRCGGLLRLRFLNVKMGHTLKGHHAIYVEAERDRRGPPVTITFKVGSSLLGSIVHHDGDGWKAFELDTSDLAGQRADVVAEIAAPSGDRRQYCFEASTR